MVCTTPARIILVTFNVLFVLFGLLLIAFGLWTQFDSRFYYTASDEDSSSTSRRATYIPPGIDMHAISWLLFMTGLFTFILGAIGGLGAYKKSRPLLSIYFLLLLSLMVTKLVGIYYVLTYKTRMEEAVATKMNVLFEKAINGSESAQNAQMSIEYLLDCCGVYGSEDYVRFDTEYSASCNSTLKNHSDTGCYKAVLNTYSDVLPAIVGTLFVMVAIELVAVLFAICICAKSKSKEYEDVL